LKAFNRNIGILFFLFLFYSCANVVAPTGGPKDIESPKIESSIPLNKSTNFNTNEVLIYFDEFVQLKNLQAELVVSPPMEETPEIKSLGKKISIKILDSLSQDQTYTLNFGEAIIDITESNTLKNFAYIFSTGSNLDSIQMSGKVLKAFSFAAPEKAFVLLYSNLNDTAPLTTIPDYIAKCNKNGDFKIQNIKPSVYKIYAIADANNNYKFDLPNELFAFNDSIYTLNYDYLKDSLSKAVNDIELILFEEEPIKRYVKEKKRETRNLCLAVFNLPLEEKVKIKFLKSDLSNNYVFEFNKSNDSLKIWLTDSVQIKKDTTSFVFNYFYFDNQDSVVEVLDTVHFTYKETKDSKTKFSMESLLHKTGNVSEHIPIQFIFSSPLSKIDTSMIHLVELVDSIKKPIPFSINPDSIKLTKYTLDFSRKVKSTYLFTADSGAFKSINNQELDSLKFLFKIVPNEKTGNLFVTLSNVNPNVIIQLVSDKDKIISEKIVSKSQKIEFKNLSEGSYKLKAIFDENKNGRWNSGKYIKKQQVEDVKIYSTDITLKLNWDFEIQWDLNEKTERKSIVPEIKPLKDKK